MLSELETSALFLSLRVALAVTVMLLIPGIAIGWALSRDTFRGKILLEAIVNLPLILPPVATGYLLLVLMGPNGWLGHWLYEWTGHTIPFSFLGAVIAGAVMAFPLMVRSIRLAMELAPKTLNEAALNLGIGPMGVFFRVILPLAMPGIIAGAMLAFARSLGEFGATITFAGNIQGETQTIPLAIFSSMQFPGNDETTIRLVLFSIALSTGALLVSQIVAHRIRIRHEGHPPC